MLNIPANLQASIKRRLKQEYFVWLTTVGSDLSPQPRPVWFVWEEERGSFLIYSQPGAHKMQHLAKHPRVALHFNSDASADSDVLVFIGSAEHDQQASPANKTAAYMRKYREGISGLNMTPEEFAREYSAAVRVTPTSVRGW